MFRKTIFWLHLICGITAGLVVLMMSVTGVLLTYERQMLAWENELHYFSEPAMGQPRLAIEELVRSAGADDFAVQSVSVAADEAAPVILRAGREARYVNAYTGEVYAPYESSMGAFLSAVRGWHRWFNINGEGRDSARAVTGTSNLMFLFLVFSGLYLWLPAVYRWSTMRIRLWFHPNAGSGQARDFNWHHVFGFWAAIPLAIVVATATVFYYPWANNLIYQLAGEEVPQRGAPAPGSDAGADIPVPDADALTIDALVQIAAAQSADWRTLTVPLPTAESAVITANIDEGNGGQPQKRHNLILNAYSGDVVLWSPFSSQSAGRQARSWVRFLHTGEALGITGQTVAGLVSFAAVLMVWTGFALAWRRFVRWTARLRRSRSRVDESVNASA